MDAYIALLLDREQYDSDLAAVQGALGDLTVTIPVTLPLPTAESLVPPAPAQDAGGGGYGAASAVGAAGGAGYYSGFLPGFSYGDDSGRSSSSGGGPRPYTEPASKRGFFGFSGWADEESTKNAPTWDTYKALFRGWKEKTFNGADDDLDYGKTFMHMANRTMEKWNVDFYGRTLAKVEDALEEPAFMFMSGRTYKNPALGAFILNRSGSAREQGEAEYMKFLQGIKSDGDGIADGIRDAGKGLKEAMEDEAEIESPSKATHRVGGMISSGAAGGLRDGIPKIKQMTRNVMDQSFVQARPRVTAAARSSSRQLTINNQFQNVSPEMQAEIKRGVDQAMRYLRIPRARA